MSKSEDSIVINVADAEEVAHLSGDHWGGTYRVLTPAMAGLGGTLGVNQSRCPPGRTVCPFHRHHREDEVFYIQSGRGILRYGDTVREIGPGDCISCPAGGEAHQIANPFDEDLVYLAIGPNDPHEVCEYPDSGKVMVRSLKTVGVLERTHYSHGEADRPAILDMKPTQ